MSLIVNCASQEEVDYFWKKLGEGGEAGACGWLKDKYGVSWQIIPTA
jgi:predicted 3-demethylubiquinone-9 3-methyltransferase (glyoxalase superfamily)